MDYLFRVYFMLLITLLILSLAHFNNKKSSIRRVWIRNKRKLTDFTRNSNRKCFFLIHLEVF